MLRESKAPTSVQTRAERFGLVALLAVFAAAWYATAWLCDDAFITLRTVDNALHGDGLVWNVGERVQAYTHPLWMLLLWLTSLPHGDLYFASLSVSALCTAVALALLITRVAVSPASGALALAALFGSRAFVDYSSSGLENPLVHALLAAYFIVCARPGGGERRQLARAALAVGLLLVRLDLVFAAAPLLLAAWRRDGMPRARTLLLAAVPLVLWEAFSLVYYGGLIANSALAKLSAGVALGDRLSQGLHYLWAALRWDPLSVLLLASAPVLGFGARDPVRWAAVGAIGAHLGWVLWIGGDFMAGRFLTPPLFLAALLLARCRLPRAVAWGAAGAIVAAVLAVPYLSPFATRDYGDDWHAAIDVRGIADERRFHLESTALRAVLRDGGWRSEDQRKQTRLARERYYQDPWLAALTQVGVLEEGEAWPPPSASAAAEQKTVFVKGGVGLFGFRMGPEAVLIDYHGLGDPLLSRLPALPSDPVLALLIPRLAHLEWRVGHYLRPVPAGYALSRALGENRIRDPDLAELYDTIRAVVRGPLFTRTRFAAIRRLHSNWAVDRIARFVEHTPAYRVNSPPASVRSGVR